MLSFNRQREWKVVSTITTARIFEKDVREILSELQEDSTIRVTRVECDHSRNTSFIQVVAEFRVADRNTADLLPMRLKTKLAKIGEAMTVVL